LKNAVRDRLERIDPVRKAARAKQRAEKKNEASTISSNDIRNEEVSNSSNESNYLTVEKLIEIKQARNYGPGKASKKVREPEFIDLMELELHEFPARAETERELFSAEIIHKVNDRDKRRCKTLLPDGTICDSGFWTQIHHIIEVKDGGTNDLENLITLCGHHHRQWHVSQSKSRKK
jgi:hypothetical protein